MLNAIQSFIAGEQNEEMIKLLDKEEVKRVVFEPNGKSVSGLDSFSRVSF